MMSMIRRVAAASASKTTTTKTGIQKKKWSNRSLLIPLARGGGARNFNGIPATAGITEEPMLIHGPVVPPSLAVAAAAATATYQHRVAVLIDADNASPRHATSLFEEVAKLGRADVRRIYGNFVAASNPWIPLLSPLSMVAIQQFNYTPVSQPTSVLEKSVFVCRFVCGRAIRLPASLWLLRSISSVVVVVASDAHTYS
jgi:hypothetical protein